MAKKEHQWDEPAEKFEKPAMNPIISRVGPKVRDQRHYVIMYGYVGEVTDDYVQIYPQLDLRAHYKVQISDIVWHEPLSPLHKSSPTIFVVKADAELEIFRVVTESVEARFISGSIAASHLRSAGSVAAPGAQTPATSAAVNDPCSGTPMAVPAIPPTIPCLNCPPTIGSPGFPHV
jgi:hypothetical protein